MSALPEDVEQMKLRLTAAHTVLAEMEAHCPEFSPAWFYAKKLRAALVDGVPAT